MSIVLPIGAVARIERIYADEVDTNRPMVAEIAAQYPETKKLVSQAGSDKTYIYQCNRGL